MRILIALVLTALVLAAAYAVWIYPRPARAPIGAQAFAESVDGQRVAFYAAGEGPRVVLLASLGRSISDFNELALALNEAGYRTVAVESRGVGASPPGDEPYTLYDLGDDVEAALVADGAAPEERVHLIGHAFGNRAARAYAARRPERVSRLVLVASGGSQRIEDDPRVFTALRRCFEYWLPPPMRREEVRIGFFATGNDIPSYWMNGWYRPGAAGQAEAVRNTPVAEWRDAGGEAPMLILQAAQDRIAPADVTSAMLRRDFGDRVEIVVIDPAGHALLPEAPAEIAARVIAFFDAAD